MAMTHQYDEGARQDDERQRVSGELIGRLTTYGVRLNGTEDPEELLAMLEAIDRFGSAVEAHGGDLMVDEGPGGRTTEPDDRHFALPVRDDGESVSQYLERLSLATDAVRHHPRRAD
jgi:hypothetical protein